MSHVDIQRILIYLTGPIDSNGIPTILIEQVRQNALEGLLRICRFLAEAGRLFVQELRYLLHEYFLVGTIEPVEVELFQTLFHIVRTLMGEARVFVCCEGGLWQQVLQLGHLDVFHAVLAHFGLDLLQLA